MKHVRAEDITNVRFNNDRIELRATANPDTFANLVELAVLNEMTIAEALSSFINDSGSLRAWVEMVEKA